MSDEADKAIRAGMRAGALGLVAGAASGDLRTTLASAALGAVGEGLVTAFEEMAAGNTDRLLLASTREDVARLAARVARIEHELASEGRKPDRTDPISQAQTVSDFVRDLTAAHSIVKREALVNAAANQHDPRIAGAATRAFWYDVLRRLPDIQVFVACLVARHGSINFANDQVVNVRDERTAREDGVIVVELEGEDFATVHLATFEMAKDTLLSSRILHEPGGSGTLVQWKGVSLPIGGGHRFTAGGRILAKLIAD